MKGSSGTSRQLIVNALTAGAVEDRSGRATAILLNKSGYTGSLTGLSSLLHAMEQSGTIKRDLKGKRCFSISLTPQARPTTPAIEETPTAPQPESTDQFDAAQIAQALLDRVIELAGTPERQSAELSSLRAEMSSMQQRLFETVERAERQRQRIRLLEDEVLARQTEADGLRKRLCETERNLHKIVQSSNGVRLDAARERELKDLIRLMRTPPGNA